MANTDATSSDDSNFKDLALAYVNDNSTDMQALVTKLREYALVTKTLSADKTQTVASNAETATISALSSGYYLILDADTNALTFDYATAGMLYNVVNADININVKGSLPTINKEVWHNDITNVSPDWAEIGTNQGSWDTVADYQIGDTVEYRITATVPQDLTGYDDTTYKYIISDELTDGLAFDTTSIAIYTSENLNENGDSTKVSNTYYTEKTNGLTDTTIFEIDFDVFDFNDNFSTDTFYVYYTATVLDTVNTFTDAEKNECNVVTLTYSNNPYDSTSTNEDSASVYSYTFNLEVLKTSDDGTTPLAGAKFALYDGAGNQLYLTNKSETYYIDESQVASSTDGIITTVSDGKFNIIGLDDAKTYVLKEIEAPSGYNVADDITFTINATYADDNGVPTPTVSVSSSDINDLSITVVNTSSSLLPSTGGVGTTAFSIVGGSLMILACVLFLVKRKA